VAGERREDGKGGPGKEGKRRLGRKGREERVGDERKERRRELWRWEDNVLRTRGRKRHGM